MVWSTSKWEIIKQIYTEACYQIFGGWDVQEKGKVQKNVWCARRNMFYSKMFTNEQNILLPLGARVKKTVHEVETHWLSGKKQVQETVIIKEDHADILLWHKKPHHNEFH